MTRRDRALTKMHTGQPLTAGDVAHILGMNPKTVARSDTLPSWRTLGGHRRYDPDVVRAYLEGRK